TSCTFVCLFFFFQAEDGIRDDLVTGVQTCALPISSALRPRAPAPDRRMAAAPLDAHLVHARPQRHALSGGARLRARPAGAGRSQIGRASCRERGGVSVGGACGEVKNREEAGTFTRG